MSIKEDFFQFNLSTNRAACLYFKRKQRRMLSVLTPPVSPLLVDQEQIYDVTINSRFNPVIVRTCKKIHLLEKK